MDPSKRICLKHLPENCTKREIAELVKNRTGLQPHSIDLGLDEDGKTRRYAHFSCEGAKTALDVLGSGAMLRGEVVLAVPAKTHYSFRYAEARRKREREDEEEAQALRDYWAESTRRFQARCGGEVPKKPPKPFYASRQRYAGIAAEIARGAREAHALRRVRRSAHVQKEYAAAAPDVVSGKSMEGSQRQPELQPPAAEATASHPVDRKPRGPAQKRPPSAGAAGREGRSNGVQRLRAPARLSKQTSTLAAAVEPPKEVAPAQPTKEERKLSGLQARLAALQAKMKKK